MKTLRQMALTAIVLVLAFSLYACASGMLPFDCDSIEQAWFETVADGKRSSVSGAELARILDELRKAEIQDITNKADAPTPTHLLVLRIAGPNPEEYTLSITDGTVNALMYLKDKKNMVFHVSSQELNATVATLLNGQHES